MDEMIEEFLGILYPSYEMLSVDEKKDADRDKEIITKYINKLSRYYRNSTQPDGLHSKEGPTKQEILRRGVDLMKMLNYLAILYPGFDEWSSEERREIMNSQDRDDIEEHIQEIDSYCKKAKELQGDERTEQQIIMDALAMIRSREVGEER